MIALFSNTQRGQAHTRNRYDFAGTSRFPIVAYLTKEILPGKPGRLHYQATEWNAISVENTAIPAGADVRPLWREGNTWLVQVETTLQNHQAA
ncbi:MAG: hypothetical protein HC929_06935 [Leptolyngbyaceae cyanobacterium SM2_5_2]|nr:hypothetical protein [Leptolyngbyaceae cyanobacterium SM2_5_2]